MLSDLGRRVIRLGRKRIDEVGETYDAAHAEARVGLEWAIARARAQGIKPGDVRGRFQSAMEALKQAFALDAIEENQSVAELHATIAGALATVTNENDALRARVEIDRAFADWRGEAGARERARKRRLSGWLADQGFNAPKTRQALQAMLAEAAGAVAIVKADEKRLRSSATEERKLVADWSLKARTAREARDEALATEAERRVAQHERNAHEWERELASQTAALAHLEGKLAEVRSSLGPRPRHGS